MLGGALGQVSGMDPKAGGRGDRRGYDRNQLRGPPKILTPARCGSDICPARIALPDGPTQVRFFLFFLFFFFYPHCFFLFSKSKQF
jgi:hypothetical protein